MATFPLSSGTEFCKGNPMHFRNLPGLVLVLNRQGLFLPVTHPFPAAAAAAPGLCELLLAFRRQRNFFPSAF